jgi:alcohol dehydrogenase/L-iditol 2-dehydrogenase
MQALVKYGQGPDQVELRDVPEPHVRPGTVRVEVKAAAICGWDIEMWRHKMANPVTVPVIQGHEFCGVITEVGDGVMGWQSGDRVACETSAEVCGKCYWCRTGEYQICPERKGFGYGVDGAFTKYVVVRQQILHKIPEGISFEEAALTEPYCVGHHALADRVKIVAGNMVMVIGPGPIGLVCLQMAKVLGAKQTMIVGTERGLERLQFAQKQGWADMVVTVPTENAAEAVGRMTGGVGADVVADCAGSAPALMAALESVRRGGQVVKVGWGPNPFNQSLDILLRKSITLSGTFGHNRHNWEAVLRLFEKKQLKPKSLISEVLPLAKWREAFEKIEKSKAIKIVLIP